MTQKFINKEFWIKNDGQKKNEDKKNHIIGVH